AVVADGVDVADLAATDPWQRQGAGGPWVSSSQLSRVLPCSRRRRTAERKDRWKAHSGSGMNSCSLGTCAKRPLFQSALACSIRSLLEETKFHQMWRGPSSASPPRNIIRVGWIAVAVMRSPGRKI